MSETSNQQKMVIPMAVGYSRGNGAFRNSFVSGSADRVDVYVA